MITFFKWLSLREDAGPLGPAGSMYITNDKRYRWRGAGSKHSCQDDDGESGPPKPANRPRRPSKAKRLFGIEKCKKCPK